MASEAPPLGRGFNLYASQETRLKASNIALIILPTLFVALRLISRKVSRAGYWWDDGLIILSLFFSYGLPICNLVSTINYGFGRHIYVLPLDTTPQFLKILYVFELFFVFTAGFNKLGILAFYRRIFPIAQLRIILLITTAVVICFSVTCLMIVTFQCVPIHTFWDIQDRVSENGHCIDVDALFLASGSVNCFFDFFITLMVGSRTIGPGEAKLKDLAYPATLAPPHNPETEDGSVIHLYCGRIVRPPRSTLWSKLTELAFVLSVLFV